MLWSMKGTDLVSPKEAERQKRIDAILNRMQQQIREVEALKKELETEPGKEPSPTEAKKLIEEIKVPDLEVLPDKKEKRVVNSFVIEQDPQ